MYLDKENKKRNIQYASSAGQYYAMSIEIEESTPTKITMSFMLQSLSHRIYGSCRSPMGLCPMKSLITLRVSKNSDRCTIGFIESGYDQPPQDPLTTVARIMHPTMLVPIVTTITSTLSIIRILCTLIWYEICPNGKHRS